MITSNMPRFNRQKYSEYWQEVKRAEADEVILLIVNGDRAAANRVRTAMQSATRNQGFSLTTSITKVDDARWELALRKKA